MPAEREEVPDAIRAGTSAVGGAVFSAWGELTRDSQMVPTSSHPPLSSHRAMSAAATSAFRPKRRWLFTTGKAGSSRRHRRLPHALWPALQDRSMNSARRRSYELAIQLPERLNSYTPSRPTTQRASRRTDTAASPPPRKRRVVQPDQGRRGRISSAPPLHVAPRPSRDIRARFAPRTIWHAPGSERGRIAQPAWRSAHERLPTQQEAPHGAGPNESTAHGPIAARS